MPKKNPEARERGGQSGRLGISGRRNSRRGAELDTRGLGES